VFRDKIWREESIRDQVIPVLLLLETTEGHLRTGNELLGVLEVFELDSNQPTVWISGSEVPGDLPKWTRSM
jgi:hypothetical protein